jgi:hypothetical protein
MYLGHGTGVDDIAIMVGVIILGLLLLRRSERSVRTRAETSEGEPAKDETGLAQQPDQDGSSI